MTLLFWLAVALVTLVAGSFAVSNNMVVTLGLWPLDGSVHAPLYLVVFTLLVIGFCFGRASAWLAYGGLRSAHRARGRELARLRERAEIRRVPAPLHAQIPSTRSLTTT